jgi:uncharacterized protein (TIGR03437 family)
VQSVSPTQVSFLVPHDLPPGQHVLEIINTRGSATVEVAVTDAAPAWIVFGRDGKAYLTQAPVRAGETVEFFAGGLGRTDPAAVDFRLIADPLPAAQLPAVEIGGRAVRVLSCVLETPGVYRIALVIPADLPAGEHGASLSSGGIAAPNLALLQVAP